MTSYIFHHKDELWHSDKGSQARFMKKAKSVYSASLHNSLRFHFLFQMPHDNVHVEFLTNMFG